MPNKEHTFKIHSTTKVSLFQLLYHLVARFPCEVAVDLNPWTWRILMHMFLQKHLRMIFQCIAISAMVCSAIFLGYYRSSVFRILKPSSKKILVFDSLAANLQTYTSYMINWSLFKNQSTTSAECAMSHRQR
ncbi:hypothetical protein NDU88_004890 [Pleurodeles waltl]|uniref:Uncharacterized protein n=1 Tax=Pleurodeles waltl TaxID=8319 RepID=A0AAV7LVZ1_PLEWA|nr:hypothetical protein NDU88_004890 [Pleurodeles waltl]